MHSSAIVLYWLRLLSQRLPASMEIWYNLPLSSNSTHTAFIVQVTVWKDTRHTRALRASRQPVLTFSSNPSSNIRECNIRLGVNWGAAPLQLLQMCQVNDVARFKVLSVNTEYRWGSAAAHSYATHELLTQSVHSGPGSHPPTRPHSLSAVTQAGYYSENKSVDTYCRKLVITNTFRQLSSILKGSEYKTTRFRSVNGSNGKIPNS